MSAFHSGCGGLGNMTAVERPRYKHVEHMMSRHPVH